MTRGRLYTAIETDSPLVSSAFWQFSLIFRWTDGPRDLHWTDVLSISLYVFLCSVGLVGFLSSESFGTVFFSIYSLACLCFFRPLGLAVYWDDRHLVHFADFETDEDNKSQRKARSDFNTLKENMYGKVMFWSLSHRFVYHTRRRLLISLLFFLLLVHNHDNAVWNRHYIQHVRQWEVPGNIVLIKWWVIRV